MVFPYVESHNFYVEHWYHTLFWNKVREFGDLLVRNDFIEEVDDVFYLQRHEISDALVDLRLAWAAGSVARGPGYWPPIVAERKRIMDAMRGWSPPPALGAVPEAAPTQPTDGQRSPDRKACPSPRPGTGRAAVSRQPIRGSVAYLEARKK